MYADRYEPRRVNRGSLVLSVGIVGGLLALGLLASPVVQHVIKEHPLPIFTVDPVTPPPPPDPVPPQPQPQLKSRPAPQIDRPTVLVPTEPKTPYVGPPVQPATPGTDEGGTMSGGAVVIDPPKPLPPVLTQAAVDARYARDFQPLYPTAERRAGRDGVVTLKVLIGVDGRVREAVQVLATTDEFWRVTQRQALGKWRFKPATRDGIPVEAWRTMTVRFTMEGEE